VGWPEALDAVAGRLKAAGPNAVFVGGTRASNEDLFVVQRLFREVLGSGNLDHRRGPAFGPGLDLCRERVPEPLSALERRPAFVAFGLDAAWEQPMAYLRVRKAWKRGRCRIVSVAGDGAEEDGRSASLGALAVARLRHRPGAEAYAAWLLARAVVAALGGSTEVSASVEERLAGPIAEPGAIGLDPVALDAAARALASCAVGAACSEESPGPAVWAGASVRGTNELDTLAALDVLASVLHGRERKASLPALEANEQGARDMGILPDVGPGGVPAAHQGWDGEQSAGAILRGEPVGLWVSGADLAATGNGVPWRDALAKCPFVVYTGAAMDETARMADVVLPVTTVAERNGTFTSAMGRVQRFLQAYEPARNARDEWWVAAQISARIGFRMDYAGAAGVLADLSRAVPGYAGCTWDELGDGGVDRTVPGAGESV
jgi:NADH-quinone oxidoreductase subunit G